MIKRMIAVLLSTAFLGGAVVSGLAHAGDKTDQQTEKKDKPQEEKK